MHTRITLLALVTLLAACSASPTTPAAPDHAARQSQYVGPGSAGDQSP